MIRKLVTLIIGMLLFLFSNLNADFHIGAIGGLNFADMDAYVDSRSKKTENLAKVCGGLLLDVDISEYFVLRFEPMYVPKGGNILDALRDIEDVEMEIKCSYLELPIFFKTNHENRLNLYFMGGPVFSYLLDCETELELDLSVIDPQINDTAILSGDLMDVTKKYDVGIAIGWGFKIPFDKVDLYGEMRYTRGLTNAREGGMITLKGTYQDEEIIIEEPLDEQENRYANQVLQLLIGITYSL